MMSSIYAVAVWARALNNAYKTVLGGIVRVIAGMILLGLLSKEGNPNDVTTDFRKAARKK